eukprot:3525308-Amphidinium_carterae.1
MREFADFQRAAAHECQQLWLDLCSHDCQVPADILVFSSLADFMEVQECAAVHHTSLRHARCWLLPLAGGRPSIPLDVR